MSATISSSKRSQSVLSESDDSPKKSPTGYFSDRGCLKTKPIRKSKFLSRKQVMFRYMEKVERINKKLRDMQKMKHKREVIRRSHETKVNIHKIYDSLNIANNNLYNDHSAGDNSLYNLIQKFQHMSRAF